MREGYTNLRVGIFLQVATTIGALVGAAIEDVIPMRALAILFGVVLLHSAFRMLRSHEDHPPSATPDSLATRLRLTSSYPTSNGVQPYPVEGVIPGFGLRFVAGMWVSPHSFGCSSCTAFPGARLTTGQATGRPPRAEKGRSLWPL